MREAAAPHTAEIHQLASRHVSCFSDLQLMQIDSGQSSNLFVLVAKSYGHILKQLGRRMPSLLYSAEVGKLFEWRDTEGLEQMEGVLWVAHFIGGKTTIWKMEKKMCPDVL